MGPWCRSSVDTQNQPTVGHPKSRHLIEAHDLDVAPGEGVADLALATTGASGGACRVGLRRMATATTVVAFGRCHEADAAGLLVLVVPATPSPRHSIPHFSRLLNPGYYARRSEGSTSTTLAQGDGGKQSRSVLSNRHHRPMDWMRHFLQPDTYSPQGSCIALERNFDFGQAKNISRGPRAQAQDQDRSSARNTWSSQDAVSIA
jgi:hypothetical protein